MRPKGKLFALLAVFAAIGLVTATGAFTTVQADRTVNVEVDGDSAALLGITMSGDAPSVISTPNNGSDGSITFYIGNSTGLNENALTVLTPIVNVTNNGLETVDLNVSATSTTEGVTVTVVTPTNSTFTGETLSSGQGTEFGLRIALEDGFDETSNFDITLNINATDANTS